MGDVIHNFPVVSDIRRHFPNAQIDWVTELAYVPLVGLHPQVAAVHSVPLRNLKRAIFSLPMWRTLREDRARLSRQNYDLVIDTQGLVKSAIVARWAGAPIAGYTRAVAREPLAARAYTHTHNIAKNQHAVERNRQLAAAALGYTIDTAPDYGLNRQTPITTPVSGTMPTVVLLHATSRENKKWPLPSWRELVRRLNEAGYAVSLPWGSAREKKMSEEIAIGHAHVNVPASLSLTAAAALLQDAVAVVGVDTGLSHLSVALNRPTIGLYITTAPALTGLYGGTHAINLGGGSESEPANVSIDAVFAALAPHLAAKNAA